MGVPGHPAICPEGLWRLCHRAAAPRFSLEPWRLHHGDPQPGWVGAGPGLRILLCPRSTVAAWWHWGADQPHRHSVKRAIVRRGAQCDVPPAALRLDSDMTHERLAVTLHGVRKSFPLGNGSNLEVLNIEQLALPADS